MGKNKCNKTPIRGLDKVPQDKLIVQKSNPLLSLSQSKLTLAEFKILDTYLARINSREPKNRIVKFGKGELEKLLGVDRIKIKELDGRLENLQSSTVYIPDPTVKKGFRRVTLFELSHAEQDDDGLWSVELMCTPTAMQYFFNIEQLGYLRYKLRCVTSISSRYTYIMFLYLEQNRFRKSWEVDLEELKLLLNCTAERYNSFKFFNAEVLKRVQKELNEKTECHYTYEPIKKARKVVAIKFTLQTIEDLIDMPNEHPKIELSENTDLHKIGHFNASEEDIQAYMKDIFENLFTYEECEDLMAEASMKLGEKATNNEFNLFLSKLVKQYKLVATKTKITNPHAYFKKMLAMARTPKEMNEWEKNREEYEKYTGTPASEELIAEVEQYRDEQCISFKDAISEFQEIRKKVNGNKPSWSPDKDVPTLSKEEEEEWTKRTLSNLELMRAQMRKEAEEEKKKG